MSDASTSISATGSRKARYLQFLRFLNSTPRLLRRRHRSNIASRRLLELRVKSPAQADYVAIHAAYTRLAEAAKRRPGLIAEQELDDARAKDQDAEAKINVAKSALEATEGQLAVSKADNQRVQSLEDYSIVTSPFTGVATIRRGSGLCPRGTIEHSHRHVPRSRDNGGRSPGRISHRQTLQSLDCNRLWDRPSLLRLCVVHERA